MFLQHRALHLLHLATQKAYTTRRKKAREAQFEIREGSCGCATVGSDFNSAGKTMVFGWHRLTKSPSLQVLCAHCFGTIQSLHVSPFNVWGPSGWANAEVSWDLLSRWRVVTSQCKHEKHVPNNFKCGLTDVIRCCDASEGNAHCSCWTGLYPCGPCIILRRYLLVYYIDSIRICWCLIGIMKS